jgi:hypothetical protein
VLIWGAFRTISWRQQTELHACFNPEEGGEIFFRKVRRLSTDCTALYPTRQKCSVTVVTASNRACFRIDPKTWNPLTMFSYDEVVSSYSLLMNCKVLRCIFISILTLQCSAQIFLHHVQFKIRRLFPSPFTRIHSLNLKIQINTAQNKYS